MSADARLPSELLHGVSLEQYAGITTATTEGFPLADVLANEQIAPDTWPSAELAWTTRVAKDGTSGPIFAELRDKRIVAEDTLARGVAPIDTDLGAWMSFLQAYVAHPAPFTMLEGAGLRLNDLSRLQRRWSRRMDADEALRRQAAELAKKGPGPLPPLRVEPAVLKPFPWSRGPAAKPAAARAPKAAAPAETSMAPGKMRLYSYVAIKARLAENPDDEKRLLAELDVQDFAATDAGWQAILRDDPELERDYRRLLETQRGKIRAAKNKPGAAGAAPVARVPAKLAGTALAVDVPRGPALPFVEDAPPGVAVPGVPVPRAPARLGGTALAVDVPQKAALPFAEGAPPPAPAIEAPKPRPRSPLGGTALAVDVPQGDALPFAGTKPAPPSPAAAPPLTLEQHASLCCEIAAAPERALETLGRYQITPAQKKAADQHYAELFAREPGSREAWDRAYQAYRTWLAGKVSR